MLYRTSFFPRLTAYEPVDAIAHLWMIVQWLYLQIPVPGKDAARVTAAGAALCVGYHRRGRYEDPFRGPRCVPSEEQGIFCVSSQVLQLFP